MNPLDQSDNSPRIMAPSHRIRKMIPEEVPIDGILLKAIGEPPREERLYCVVVERLKWLDEQINLLNDTTRRRTVDGRFSMVALLRGQLVAILKEAGYDVAEILAEKPDA